jgi:hypothetical protein
MAGDEPVVLVKFAVPEAQANSVVERVRVPADGEPASSKLSDQNCVCAEEKNPHKSKRVRSTCLIVFMILN